VSRLMPLDDLLSVDIDMEFMCVPRRVHNLDLAEPLPPFVLGFDFFDRAPLGGQRRPDACLGLVGREGLGALIVVRMRRHHHASGGEQQRGQEAHKHSASALILSHANPPVIDREVTSIPTAPVHGMSSPEPMSVRGSSRALCSRGRR
jgi:hypothetical protein